MTQPYQPLQPHPYPAPPQPREPPKKKRRWLLWALIIAGLLWLVAWGAIIAAIGEDEQTAAPAPSSAAPTAANTAVAAQEYATVIELRDAVVAAGYPCPNWQQNSKEYGPKFAAESGKCTDNDVLSTYATAVRVEQQIEMAAGVVILVRGPNWLLNIPESHRERVRAALGGEIVDEGELTADDEPTPDTGEAAIDKSDIELKVKIKSKKCTNYSTIPDSCDIEYKIDAGVDRTGWPDEGELDVTYEVRGGVDGPEQNTLTMDLAEGTYEQDSYRYTETRSASRKLKASVVDLEYSEY
jgi:hypothetical protein